MNHIISKILVIVFNQSKKKSGNKHEIPALLKGKRGLL